MTGFFSVAVAVLLSFVGRDRPGGRIAGRGGSGGRAAGRQALGRRAGQPPRRPGRADGAAARGEPVRDRVRLPAGQRDLPGAESTPPRSKRSPSWGANAVRVPLNESCWLGINGIPPEYRGATYRAAIGEWVTRLEEGGMYVILELQFAAPGTAAGRRKSSPMPDADHAPAFWHSVADTFKDDRAVVFDLYNEPHDVSWHCWEYGCQVEGESAGSYEAVGMRRLVKVVRADRRPPADPAQRDQLRPQPDAVGVLPAARSARRRGRLAPHLRFRSLPDRLPGRARRRSPNPTRWWPPRSARPTAATPTSTASWTGRTSTASPTSAGRGTPTAAGPALGGPALIRDYDGTPTDYGIGLREHLRSLGGRTP